MNTSSVRKNEALVVLGMHRSGTSAITRVMNLFGYELGEDLLQSQRDNVKGFWEDAQVVGLNDRILSALNSSWDDPAPLPMNWWELPEIGVFREEIESVLDQEYRQREFWAVKDPRLCRLLPLWLSVIEHYSCSTKFLLVFRNPVEVVESLLSRAEYTETKLSRSQAYLLWLRYTLESEAYTRGLTRAFLSYADVLEDWRESVQKVIEDLNISRRFDSPTANEDISRFLDQGLYHHKFRDDALFGDLTIPDWVKQVYAELLETSRHKKPIEKGFDDVRKELASADAIYSPFVAETKATFARIAAAKTDELSRVENKLSELAGRLEENDAVITEKSGQLQECEKKLVACEERYAQHVNSRSWRLTAPLRWLKKRV